MFDDYDSSIDRLLTTGEVARACGVSVGGVKQWIRQNKLRAAKTPGGHFRIPADEFRRFRVAYGFPARARERLRVLVVDDDRDLVETVLDNLRTLRPAPTLEAAFNGYDGLLKVGTFRPRVLLLDLTMPGLDGFQVCRQIKADRALGATRIVVITGDTALATRDQAVHAGADAFLGKPLDFAELRRWLNRFRRWSVNPHGHARDEGSGHTRT